MLYEHLRRQSLFIQDKPILLLERMLHKDYSHKGSVGGGEPLVVSLKGIGGKSPVLN
jgi:hypothetical protein